MTHYLRDKLNRTIVDIEAMKDDISCVVSIYNYSYFLLNIKDEFKRSKFIIDMDEIQEIRGCFFEVVNGKYTPDELAKIRCKELAKEYGLYYVVD